MKLRVKVDLYADWIELLRKQLAAAGYPPSAGDSDQTISLRFFSLQRRLVLPRPRKVFVARELACPPEHKAGLDAIGAKAAQGLDLRPHMSRRLSDPDYNDLLLNDWGIHHFHLSASPHATAPSFLARTGPVLFARVTDEAFYMVDVMGHGDWVKKRAVEILHKNWPETIERYRLKDVLAVEPVWTEEQRKKLRNAHFLTLLQLDDGAVYAPMGGGMMSSGYSMDALDESDRHARWVHELEKRVRANAATFVEEARKEGHQIGPHLRFKLVLNAGGVPLALEWYSKIAFPLT